MATSSNLEMEFFIKKGTLSESAARVIPIWEDLFPMPEHVLQGLGEPVVQMLKREQESGNVSGKLGETKIFHVFDGVNETRLVVTGVGSNKDSHPGHIRQAAASLCHAARKERLQLLDCPVWADARSIEADRFGSAFAEGMLLAGYRFQRYRTARPEDPAQPESPLVIQLWTNDGVTKLQAGLMEGQIKGQAVRLARDLTNEPSNRLTPEEFVKKAVEVAQHSGLGYEVLDVTRLQQLGMGGILAVGQGSDHPPSLVVLKYESPNRQTDRPAVALVGKGVTFDTGGISLKPPDSMQEMKTDMAGAAAVLGAMQGIVRLGAPVDVLGILCIAENMPSGRAQKPGDVIETFAGKTVEVLNTDAEGRLLLADGVAYARSLGAGIIVDIATLTGAVVIALGTQAAGMMGNDPDLLERLRHAGERSGERLWQLPIFKEYQQQYESQIADLKNVGGREAGSITAAMIIGEFVGDARWAHLDIAGTAWEKKGSLLQPVGATGFGTRTLIEFVKELENGE